MRLLLLACLRAQTGNATTAGRIQDHLEAVGHKCSLKDAFGYENPSEIANLISAEKFEAALAIHLYKGGRLLQGSRIPFGIIFGGTDINEDIKHEEKHRVMGAVLEEARFAVAFTKKMKELAAAEWPGARSKIYIQTQGDTEVLLKQTQDESLVPLETVLLLTSVDQDFTPDPRFSGIMTTPSATFNWKRFLQNAEWHRREPHIHLVIIGPAYTKRFESELMWKINLKQIDPLFTSEVNEKVNRAPGVHLLQEIPQDDLHAVVKRCFAVVNSSISEGMSAAILEAMDLDVPVLARNIPGNAAIIKHKDTGLLFTDPQEFVHLSKSLMNDPSLEREIVTQAKAYLKKHHSWECERKAYQNFVLRLQ